MKKLLGLVVVAFALASCASLPPTRLAICGDPSTWSTGVVCRAPTRDDARWEESRNYLWEATYMCKWPPDLFPQCGCFIPRGAQDTRGVYSWAGACSKESR